MEEIITRAIMKLPELLGGDLSEPVSTIDTNKKLQPWLVQSAQFGVCVMALFEKDEDEAFSSIFTHHFLKPVPLRFVEESFEIRFGYILVSRDDIKL